MCLKSRLSKEREEERTFTRLFTQIILFVETFYLVTPYLTTANRVSQEYDSGSLFPLFLFLLLFRRGRFDVMDRRPKKKKMRRVFRSADGPSPPSSSPPLSTACAHPCVRLGVRPNFLPPSYPSNQQAFPTFITQRGDTHVVHKGVSIHNWDELRKC